MDQFEEAVGTEQALMPKGGWLPYCGLCGAVFLNRKRHIGWHSYITSFCENAR